MKKKTPDIREALAAAAKEPRPKLTRRRIDAILKDTLRRLQADGYGTGGPHDINRRGLPGTDVMNRVIGSSRGWDKK